MSRALLEIEDLTVAYRSEDGRVTTAAEGVTLSLDRGESLCVVGESGSGKSSVAMSVARLLPSPPAFWPKGRILFDGEDVLAMDVARLRELRGRREFRKPSVIRREQKNKAIYVQHLRLEEE